MSAPPRRVLALFTAFAPLAAPAAAGRLLQDGFEQRGPGRRSSGESR